MDRAIVLPRRAVDSSQAGSTATLLQGPLTMVLRRASKRNQQHGIFDFQQNHQPTVWCGVARKDQWRWSVRTGFNKQLASWRRGVFVFQHTTGQLSGVVSSPRQGFNRKK
ncbi:hypothetical protein FHT03_000209 [Xanthomonas arboricola]